MGNGERAADENKIEVEGEGRGVSTIDFHFFDRIVPFRSILLFGAMYNFLFWSGRGNMSAGFAPSCTVGVSNIGSCCTPSQNYPHTILYMIETCLRVVWNALHRYTSC